MGRTRSEITNQPTTEIYGVEFLSKEEIKLLSSLGISEANNTKFKKDNSPTKCVASLTN